MRCLEGVVARVASLRCTRSNSERPPWSCREGDLVGNAESTRVTTRKARKHVALGRVDAGLWLRDGAGNRAGAGARNGRSTGDGRGAGNGLCACNGRGSTVVALLCRRCRLSVKDLGAGALCGVRLGVAPDAVVDLWIRLLVDAWDLDEALGRQGAGAAGHAELRAAVVELGLAVVGAVQANVLGAHEVLAVGDVGGELERHAVLVPCAPCVHLDVAARLAHRLLVDLEPVARAVVGACGGGCLGQVHLSGAGVPHGSPDAEGHGEGVAGFDFRSGFGALVGGAKVAAEVGVVGSQVVKGVLPLGGHVGDGASVGAHVVAGSNAVDNESVEEVVG
jgi:hypothetical protein